MLTMEKITQPFIIRQYQSGVKNYAKYTTKVGLWASEKYVFAKYLSTSDRILDLGCGTGRTTFHLYKMGFENILGVDITPEMIVEAKKLKEYFQVKIPFFIGDATQLDYEDASFDAVIFSFNGIMSIPTAAKRTQAMQEISRVLKPGGTFIFTTHDRNNEASFLEFWQEETIRWQEGKQNPVLFEFGDLLVNSKNEEREIFIHIPVQAEVVALLENAHFEVLETFYRVDKFDESAAVKAQSGECRFWITQKTIS